MSFTDEKYDHYDSVRNELGLTSIWSIFEVENLSERHPYQSSLQRPLGKTCYQRNQWRHVGRFICCRQCRNTRQRRRTSCFY